MAESTGVSTYNSISYDVCLSSDLSNLTPLSSSCSDAASTFSDAVSVMELPPSIGSGSDVFFIGFQGDHVYHCEDTNTQELFVMNEGRVQAWVGGWAYLQWGRTIGNSVQREEGTKGEEHSNNHRHGAHCRCR